MFGNSEFANELWYSSWRVFVEQLVLPIYVKLYNYNTSLDEKGINLSLGKVRNGEI